MTASVQSLLLKTEAETAALATRFAARAQRGDCFLLSGEIGAGKSAFARAFIRARLRRQEDVPSPTFTIVQTYDDTDGDIWHCDLYRLTDVDEVIELGLDDAFETAICLIEWPDRLADMAPPDAISMNFAALDTQHSVAVTIPPVKAAQFREALNDD